MVRFASYAFIFIIYRMKQSARAAEYAGLNSAFTSFLLKWMADK